MRHALAIPLLALVAMVTLASRADAYPIVYSIDACVQGDCAAFDQSGGGEIRALIDIVNGNDLLITLSNRLNSYANGDDPYITNIGFDYGSLFNGLTFDSFTVLNGTVATPQFSVDTSIRSFFIDFGFVFSQDGRSLTPGGFQVNEAVQILVETSGPIDLDQFGTGVVKAGGAGFGAISNAIVLTGQRVANVPEPGTLALLGVGLVGLTIRRRDTVRRS